MDLSLVLEVYFRGERQLGFSFFFIGLSVLGVAFWAWRTQVGPFGTALTVTAIVVGLGMAGAGAWFDRKTETQLDGLRMQLAERPAELVTQELARMEKVNANWSRARLMWLCSGLIGAVLLCFVRKDLMSAIGLALVCLSAVLFVVDELGERRAAIYTAALAETKR